MGEMFVGGNVGNGYHIFAMEEVEECYFNK